MILINYDTTQYYERDTGDKYYCKTLHSAKRKLKELLKKDCLKDKTIKEILKPLDIYMFDLKTCFSPGTLPNLEMIRNTTSLYIGLSDEELF